MEPKIRPHTAPEEILQQVRILAQKIAHHIGAGAASHPEHGDTVQVQVQIPYPPGWSLTLTVNDGHTRRD